MVKDKKIRIFLSGFMGAGKSRIGRALRDKTGVSFYDSDHVIEQKAGKTISRIFEEDGENTFRNLERETVKELAHKDSALIIALGGGAVLQEENRKIMRETGYIVYLKSSPQAIYDRVKHKTHRPLLRIDDAQNTKEKILEKIRSLLAERETIYEQADLIIERDGMEAEEVADKISAYFFV